MITREQALTADYFHAEPCTSIIGPRGGEKRGIEIWRRNGKTQTWKKRPEQFRIPVKHGLHRYGSINEGDADNFHVAEDCPLLLKPGDHVHARMRLADLSPWKGL